LFQGRLTIITPAKGMELEPIERTAAFWKALGCRIQLMGPEEHDRALALTSHLPHLVASALAGILPRELHGLTATGFRDTTRVAAGDPSIWTGIFVQNQNAILDVLKILEGRLEEFRDALKNGNREALDTLLARAKEVRDALGS